jgi:hypothetical protein
LLQDEFTKGYCLVGIKTIKNLIWGLDFSINTKQ